MTHVLTNDVLPKRLEQTVKYLQLQAANLTWDVLTRTLINEDIQSKPENPDPTLSTTAIATKSQKQKHRTRKGNYKKRNTCLESQTLKIAAMMIDQSLRSNPNESQTANQTVNQIMITTS